MQPTLSVILPNYNHAVFLRRCLDALLAQSVLPTEIILIDDASTDHSREIIGHYCQQYPHLIHLYRNEKNQGVVYGMNRGLQLAQGDYVYYAAADDQVLPGLFEKSLSLLARYPQAALCCTIGDWWEVSSGYHWHVAVGMAAKPTFLDPEQLVLLEKKGTLFIASHTAIMRRKTLLEAGGFLSDLRWHCDWFALYATGFRHGICYIPEPLARFNIHAASFYTRGRKGDQHRQVIQRMLDYLAEPGYADVAARIRDSGALFLFAGPMLRALLQRPAYRPFLNAVFLRKNLWHSLKLMAKRVLPPFVAHWYFRTFYRAQATPSGHDHP